MIELNLPPYPYKVKQEKDKILIFDELRRRYVTLTPEEWVRQHFVAYLVNQKEFPRGLIGNEISLTLNKCNRRCDTIVYDRNGNIKRLMSRLHKKRSIRSFDIILYCK